MSKYKIGDIIAGKDAIILSKGRRTREIVVINTGDRAIQIGSHYHLFEANKALKFDREIVFGMHLDIPAGTAARFEPGMGKKVTCVEYAGKHNVMGFNGLTMGCALDENVRRKAIQRGKERGFL